MFGSTTWRQYRQARAKAASERTIRKLRGRASVREAEDIVEAAWLEQLARADSEDPKVPLLLERRERSAFADATRRRAAEAEADREKLAAIAQEMSEMTRSMPPGR